MLPLFTVISWPLFCVRPCVSLEISSGQAGIGDWVLRSLQGHQEGTLQEAPYDHGGRKIHLPRVREAGSTVAKPGLM